MTFDNFTKNLDPETAQNLQKGLERTCNNDKFAQLMGLKLIEAKPGAIVTELVIKKEHLNGANITHGGVLSFMADQTIAITANSFGPVSLTLSMNIMVLQPSTEGDILKASGEKLRQGNTVGNFAVNIYNQKNQLIAYATAVTSVRPSK